MLAAQTGKLGLEREGPESKCDLELPLRAHCPVSLDLKFERILWHSHLAAFSATFITPPPDNPTTLAVPADRRIAPRVSMTTRACAATRA